MSVTLDSVRRTYQPKFPDVLKGAAGAERSLPPAAIDPSIAPMFPGTFDLPSVEFTRDGKASPARKLRIGVVFSGGPAPGGHNVISGLFDGLKAIHPESTLFGFLGGPSGILKNKGIEIDADLVDRYRNTGGFDLIGSGRTKLSSREDFQTAMATARTQVLDGILVIGGDDSNTNACMLAEHAHAAGSHVQVIGIPKTIDGDLRGGPIETSFGFDTACKIYSELIGNIQRDALSVRKYWHFIKLMGRSASHIALECALQCRPNITFISEEISARQLPIHELVDQIADSIATRSAKGEDFGTVLIPEGLIEFVPEMRILIDELNEILAKNHLEFAALETLPHKREYMVDNLSPVSAGLYRRLPREVANQLFMDRDPHGNVQVARIDTERLLIELVEHRLQEWREQGKFSGSFAPQRHYFGYEGRCAPPSNFDADYTYTLGRTAALLFREGVTGYIVSVRNLAQPASAWRPGGAPLSRMMNLERRHGKETPVIRKALVDPYGPVFTRFAGERDTWVNTTSYQFPGPLQYFGPEEISERRSLTLQIENGAA